MKKLFLALLLTASPAFAQVTTTVSDTLLGPGGTPVRSTFTVVAGQTFTAAGGTVVLASAVVRVATSATGSFSVALVPNGGGVPAGNYYVVTYTLSQPPPAGTSQVTEFWIVPVSGSPVNLAAVRVASPVTPSLLLGMSQVTPPANCFALGGFVQWTAIGWICNAAATLSANNTFTGNNTLTAGQNSLNFFQHNGNFWTGTNAANYPFTNPQTQIANCLTLVQLGCKIQLVSGSSFTTSSQTDIGTANGAGNHHTVAIEGQPDTRWRFTGTAGGTTAAWSLHNGSALYGSNLGTQAGSAGNRPGGFALTYDCAAKSAYGLSTAEGIGATQAYGSVTDLWIEGCQTGTVAGGGSPSVAMFNWQGITSINDLSNIQILSFANTIGFRLAGEVSSNGGLGPILAKNIWSLGNANPGAIPCVVTSNNGSGILPITLQSGVCNNPGSGMDAFFIDGSTNTGGMGALHSVGQYFEDMVNGNNKMVHVHHAGNILFESPMMLATVGDTGFHLDQTGAGGTCAVQVNNLHMYPSAVTAFNNTISGFALSGFAYYPFYHYGGQHNSCSVAPMFIDDNNLALVNGSLLHVYKSIDPTITNYSRFYVDATGTSVVIGTQHGGTGTPQGLTLNSDSGNITTQAAGVDKFQFGGNQLYCVTDNACDLGAIGPAHRIRNIFVATAVRAGVITSDQGAACTNGELALSAEWGTTATVTAVVGISQTCEWTITSSGTGQAANPRTTDTLVTALPVATIVCDMRLVGGTGLAALSGAGLFIDQTTLSATAPVFTVGFTPVAGSTYKVVRRCGP